MYLNFLYNKLMSRGCEYRYISTEERAVFFEKTEFSFMPDAREIYSRIVNGAAQADFWSVGVLWKFGGVYLDMDATLVCPISWTLKDVATALFTGKNRSDPTNFFLATTPENPIFRETMLNIRKKILASDSGDLPVFDTTGPKSLAEILQHYDFTFKKRKYVCVQGFFANERFQYADHPHGPWRGKGILQA
ncbi:MAG: glycosyl transferase [Opitutae bacterium]|nr:glycosyl transferase [Opitutae bacterium]